MTATLPVMSGWAVCKCFFERNLFIKRSGWNDHVTYLSDVQFRSDYGHRPQLNEALRQAKEEIQRRRRTKFEVSQRKENIRKCYTSPLHPDVYEFSQSHLDPKFVQPIQNVFSMLRPADGIKELGPEVYQVPVFNAGFCNRLVAELKHFQSRGIPFDRPNSMNRYGIVLDELLDFSDVFATLRRDYLQPLARSLFPQNSDIHLDSHRAFVVKYKMGEDVDLGLHFDNAEVTLSVALSPESDFEGGELLFSSFHNGKLKHEFDYEHKQGQGVFHLGSKLHQALPIEEGERWNLVFWMRSSQIRNEKCPMCQQKPSLEPAPEFGDGFAL